MSFLAPIAFLFALSLPVVVVLYLLKRRRTPHLTPSTILWQKYLAEAQANSPFQKLRRHWLMVLQLILLALLVLALARPFIPGTARPARLRVLVLDASASMQAIDVKPSRFAVAQKEAVEWLQGLKEGEQAMVLWAGPSAEVRQSPTSDKSALLRAIEECRPSDGSTRLKEALQTAAAFTYEKKGEETAVTGEIHLFSDGVAGDLQTLENRNLPIVYHKIGQGGRNIGITSMDIRANPDNPAERAVFLNVLNASSTPLSSEVDLLFDNQIVQTRALSLEASNQSSLVFIASQQVDGVFTVRLRAEDDLITDNQASIHSILPRPIPVHLFTRGNRFLEKGLRTVPYADVRVSSSLEPDFSADGVVVLDGMTPTVWPPNPVLTFRSAPESALSNVLSRTTPPVVDWHRSHPVMRSVALDNVDLSESLLPDLPPWGVALVQSEDRPLVVAGEWSRRRLIWVGFDPLQSNWPLRVSFPIFLANAVEWLNPMPTRNLDRMLKPGDAVRASVRNADDTLRLTRPDGSSMAVRQEPGSSDVIVGGTDHQGIYHLRWHTNTMTYCVNLLDAAETQIHPRDELPFGRYESTQAASMKPSSRELWKLFALIALGFLLFEWWYFHRRTA